MALIPIVVLNSNCSYNIRPINDMCWLGPINGTIAFQLSLALLLIPSFMFLVTVMILYFCHRESISDECF